MDPAAQLAARPTSAQIVARYDEMQKKIRDRLDTAIGPFEWKIVRDGDNTGCGGNFSNLNGIVVFMKPWGFDSPIPDTNWPRAEQIITSITTQYGFTAPTLQIDQPGHHETTATDPSLGANYRFGTQINTTMQITTGCHRPS